MLASLNPAQRNKAISKLSDEEIDFIEHDWRTWARPHQILPEGDWKYWVIKAGRGWGKTRTGAEGTREIIDKGDARHVALVGPTLADVRDVMVTGEATGPEDGLLNLWPHAQRPLYLPSKRMLRFHNGATATIYSSEEPERLRGPQHDLAWGDELRAWKYPDKTWSNLNFGLRRGKIPRAIVTTTPRPFPLLKKLLKNPRTHLVNGATSENFQNLSPDFIDEITREYGGTRLGRQELEGELLEDVEGALWTMELIDKYRVAKAPDLVRLCIAVDPSVTDSEASAEAGIVVVGTGVDGHYYVLDDLSMRASPLVWMSHALKGFDVYDADRVVGEVNNGGDLIESLLRQIRRDVPFKAVRASRNKQIRAEPTSALYEQGRVHHVGSFLKLEDQMTQWVPDGKQKSPDRLDALVWGLTWNMTPNEARLTFI